MSARVPKLELKILPEAFAIARLPADAPTPEWPRGELVSITRTADELSIVCAADVVPSDVTAERGWRAFAVVGPLEFSLTGVLASLAAPLADAGISIFALATYDTDYVLVNGENLERAAAALAAVGHTVVA